MGILWVALKENGLKTTALDIDDYNQQKLML